MNIEWVLYLTNVFDSLSTMAGLFVLMWAIVVVVMVIFILPNHDYESKETMEAYNAIFKKSLYILIPCIIIGTFIPSEKTMYMIIGSHYLKSSAIPTKVEKVIEKKLDEYLVEPKINNDTHK